VVSPERTIGGIRPDHCHIGDAVAKLKADDAIAELIDFSDDVITHHEGRPPVHRLRIEVTPDQNVSVLQPRGEYADPHLARASRRQRDASSTVTRIAVFFLPLRRTATTPPMTEPHNRVVQVRRFGSPDGLEVVDAPPASPDIRMSGTQDDVRIAWNYRDVPFESALQLASRDFNETPGVS
jgi:hypothetical protein